MNVAKAKKIVSLIIFANVALKLAQLIFFTSIGFDGSLAFYVYQSVAWTLLGIGVFLGFRLAWIISGGLSILLGYIFVKGLVSIPWAAMVSNWKGLTIVISDLLTLAIYVSIILSFFWLERLKISEPTPTDA